MGRSRVPSLSFRTLKRLSFTHSTVYLVLLTVWLLPGLHPLEFVFGLAHGLGWIAMCALCTAAVAARVIPLRLAVAVAVIGAIGPFVGSYEFVREDRRRRAARGPSRDAWPVAARGGADPATTQDRNDAAGIARSDGHRAPKAGGRTAWR